MKKTTLRTYIHFGQRLRSLQEVTKDSNLEHVLDCSEVLEKLCADIGFRVSERVIEKKRNKFSRMKNDESGVLGENFKEIAKDMEVVHQCIDAEVEEKYVFVTTDKSFHVEYLLNNFDRIFSNTVFERLPEVAKHDLQEAGKCIAFEVSTAAAFHILRGTECVLRHFYEGRKRKNRISGRMWGPIIQDLRNLRSPPDKALLDHLDNIRLTFRNPTQHPEKIYDLSETQNLLHVCVDVIERMVSDSKWVDPQ